MDPGLVPWEWLKERFDDDGIGYLNKLILIFVN